MSTLPIERSLSCSTWSARSLGSNSISVTWPTMLARSIAASTPELPPPITATRLPRSEEHTSELQSLMRISYAVFCLKKEKVVGSSAQSSEQAQLNYSSDREHNTFQGWYYKPG